MFLVYEYMEYFNDKKVLINILSGTMLPVWFLPKKIVRLMEITPFQAIYVIPVKIYLQQIDMEAVINNLILQVIWVLVLSCLGNILWHYGKRKIIIQGG